MCLPAGEWKTLPGGTVKANGSRAQTVLFLETGTQGGGSFVSLYQYLQAMDLTRFRPVVCFVNETHFVEKIRAPGIPVYLLYDPLYTRHNNPLYLALRAVQRLVEKIYPVGRLLFDRLVHGRTALNLFRLMEQERVALLVLNVQIDRDQFALSAAQRAHVPVVSHLRSIQGAGFSAEAARRAGRQVVSFVANSNDTQAYWEDRGLPPDPIHVVYNAIPEQRPSAVALDSLGVPPGSPVVCCIGRLAWIKGQDVLIQAVAACSKEFPTLHLLLIGEGKERSRLEALVKAYQIESRVIFTGWREDGVALAASASVLVVPSREEPFGRTVIEGMFAGVPVVASRVGGIPEIITDGTDGLLVAPEDPQPLADALCRLLRDPQLRQTIAGAARHTAQERFSLSTYVRQVESIYRAALGGSA